MKQELYARIVMPERSTEDNRFVYAASRYGAPSVELVDEAGTVVANLRGLQGVNISASDQAFMDVSIQLIADVVFPEKGQG